MKANFDTLLGFIRTKSQLKAFLGYFFVFALFFAVFYYIQFSFPYLSGVDAWYHIKHSWLIRTQGIRQSVNNFPWLQHTILKSHPADLWFGFHILLLPFTFGNLILGAKIAGAIFAALVFLGFFWVLRRFKIRYAFLWTLFLFFVTHFYFSYRLLLVRPHILSISFSLLGVYFISQKRYLGLFLLSLLWAFVSPEVLLIVAMGVLWIIVEYWQKKKFAWQMLTLPPLGVFLALLIRPDFPNNLYLLYNQIFTMFSLKFAGVPLNFGKEIVVPFLFIEPLPLSILIFLLTVFLLAYIIVNILEKKLRKIPIFHLFLSLLSFSLGGIALFSSARFVEYWAPFTVLFGALVFDSVIRPKIPKTFDYFKSFKNYNLPPAPQYLAVYQKVYRALRATFLFFQRRPGKLLMKTFLFLFFFYFVTLQIILLQIIVVSGAETDSFDVNTFKEAAEWLKENTPSGSLVMNNPWYTFSFLFFYNHQNYYASGMDPTFMYVKDPKLYWLWNHISGEAIICDKEKCPEIKKRQGGLEDQEVHQIFKDKFQADYILLDTNKGEICPRTGKPLEWFSEFREFLKKSRYFEKVFERGKIEIYKIN